MPIGMDATASSQSRLRFCLRSGSLPDVQSESLADDLDPIAKEVDDHRDQRARVQRDIERQAAVLPTEEPGDQDQMRGAANGQKFGERLHNREDNRLVNGHELAS